MRQTLLTVRERIREPIEIIQDSTTTIDSNIEFIDAFIIFTCVRVVCSVVWIFGTSLHQVTIIPSIFHQIL